MMTAYDQGYTEGRSEFADTRACPYESAKIASDWLDGFDAGQAQRRADLAKAEAKETSAR